MSSDGLMLKAAVGKASVNIDLCQILSRITNLQAHGNRLMKRASERGDAEWYWVVHQHIAVERPQVITLDNGYRGVRNYWALLDWRPVISSFRDHWSVVDGGLRGPESSGGNGDIPLEPPTTVFQDEYMTLVASDVTALTSYHGQWGGDMASDGSDDFSEDDPRGWPATWMSHFYGLEERYHFQVKYVFEAVKVGNPYGLLEITSEISGTVRTRRNDSQIGKNPFLFTPLTF